MAGSSQRTRKTPSAQPRGFPLIEVLLIASIVVVLCAAGFWWADQAGRDAQFNQGFNERAEQYRAHIGEKDPFMGLIDASLNSCADYSRMAAQIELEKSNENPETRLYRLHQAGIESFDACVNQHLVDLQSVLKDDRLAVLQAGLECDKGCPMRVIQGFGPWQINPDATLTHIRGR